MNAKALSAVGLGVLFIVGCASKPEDIAASGTSDTPYRQWTCERLAQEASQVSAALAAASKDQRLCRAQDDVAIVAVGLPASKVTGCDKASKVAALKGQLQALQDVAIEKNCRTAARPSAPAPRSWIP